MFTLLILVFTSQTATATTLQFTSNQLCHEAMVKLSKSEYPKIGLNIVMSCVRSSDK